MRELPKRREECRTIDLGQLCYLGMPHHPNHPPYVYGVSKMHRGSIRGGVSAAAEWVSRGGHVGTPIDALCHCSLRGRLFARADALGSQSLGAGLAVASRRHQRGLRHPAAGCRSGRSLRGAGREPCRCRSGTRRCRPRTHGLGDGLERRRSLRSRHALPGVNREAAGWLSERGVFAVTSGTVAFEFVPAPTMPVHVRLLAESDVRVIEALDLETLSSETVRAFPFVAAPPRMRGGTGSPIRRLALAARWIPTSGRRSERGHEPRISL